MPLLPLHNWFTRIDLASPGHISREDLNSKYCWYVKILAAADGDGSM